MNRLKEHLNPVAEHPSNYDTLSDPSTPTNLYLSMNAISSNSVTPPKYMYYA